MIYALAGRRIDLPNAERARFPMRNLELVRTRLRTLFEGHTHETLVCSAACGADLLALEVAGELAWRRRVILPFARERFRETSVTDRPGDWGRLYDQVLDAVQSARDLLIESTPAAKDPYAFATDRILEEAAILAAKSGESPVAVVVWEGDPRDSNDLTKEFAALARERGMEVLQVSTLE